MVTGLPPSLPADAVTLTVAVPLGAVSASVVPFTLLSAAVARVPTAAVAGMNAISFLSPLPRMTWRAATTGTVWSVGARTREPASPRVTSPRSTVVVMPALTCRVSFPAGVIRPAGEARRIFRSASSSPGAKAVRRTSVASFGMPGRDQTAGRVGGRGQPVAARLVVQGLYGRTDPPRCAR